MVSGMAIFGMHLGASVCESIWRTDPGPILRLSGSEFFPGFSELITIGFARGIDSTTIIRSRRFFWTYFAARIGILSAGRQAILKAGNLFSMDWDKSVPGQMVRGWIDQQIDHFYCLAATSNFIECLEFYKEIDDYARSFIERLFNPNALELILHKSDILSGRLSKDNPFVKYSDDSWIEAKRRFKEHLEFSDDD